MVGAMTRRITDIAARAALRLKVLLTALLPALLPALMPTLMPSMASAADIHPAWVARTLTVADGLPVNAATAVRIGPEGFLWVSTWDGLARYDGLDVSRYRTDTHPELTSNRLIDLALDTDGVLWLFAENQRLGQVRDGRLMTLDAADEALLGAVLTHRLDDRGRLWLGTEHGVFIAHNDAGHDEAGDDGSDDPGEEQFTTVCRVDDSVRINDLAPGAESAGSPVAFLATPDSGVLRCGPSGVEPIDSLSAPASEKPPSVASVHHFGRTVWWIDAEGLHNAADGNRQTLQRWRDQGALVWAGLMTAGGTLWARTADSVYAIGHDGTERILPAAPESGWIPRFVATDAAGGTWLAHGKRLYLDGELIASLDHQINDFELGDDGSVWLATDGDGVIRLRRRVGEVFAHLDLVAGSNLYAVARSPSNPERIWLGGMRTGLLAIEDGTARRYPANNLEGDDGSIWTILEDREGRIWHGGTVLCLRLEDDSCDTDRLSPALTATEGPGREIRLLMQDRSGAVWIGAGAGLYRHENGNTERIDAAPAATIRTGLERDDGSIWFGSNGAGLFLWRNGSLHQVSGELESGLIRSLYEDAGGVLWVGTEDRGLLRLEIDDSVVNEPPVITDQRRFGPQQGLWDNVIHFVTEDRHGRLWMNSNRGVFWIERERLDRYDFSVDGGVDGRLPVVGYTEADGLLGREGNGGTHSSGLLDDDGDLWLPGQAGVVRIDTDQAERNPRPPLTVIESARVADREPTVRPSEVHLEGVRRDLTVAYSAAIFRHGDRARFEYRLAGYDDWNAAGARREAIYTNLPAGDYRFEVRAASADGGWSEQPAAMPVHVAPRYYEQAWFFALVALLLAGLGTFAWRRRLAGMQAHAEELRQQVAERTRDLHKEQEATEQALSKVAHQAEQLRELDNTKSRFFTNLSHELRTPLTLIVGPAGQTLEQFPDLPPEQVEGRLRAIRDNGERLLELVNQIQALSRLEAGYRPLKTAGGDLAALCRELQGRFAPSAAERGLEVIGPPADCCCTCVFDHDAVDKIVGNLLGNALRHSTEGGRIGLDLRRVTGGVVISVADEGPGIPPERVDKVFDRFFTAEHEGAGSGIGLALARELAHLHGGDLNVESEPGKGSVFKLVLPVEIERWAEGSADAPGVALPRAGARTATPRPEEERTTVLVVEDQPGVRDFVVECLAPSYRVLAAEDGLEGLKTARAELPDLIVSDIMMPGVDGIELARRLAAEPATRALPVILLTAKTTAEDELEGLESGAVDYLTKPFSPEILNARIQRMLGFARRLREQVRIERADRARLAEAEEREPGLAERLEQLLLPRLDDEDLDVQTLAEALHMSRSGLKRAMRDAGLKPPATFVRELRMREAATLLERRRGTVSEVAYAVGFGSLSHFTRRFHEHFGMTPTAWIESHAGDA